MMNVKIEDQLIDIFTKGLSNAKVQRFQKLLGMVSIATTKECN